MLSLQNIQKVVFGSYQLFKHFQKKSHQHNTLYFQLQRTIANGDHPANHPENKYSNITGYLVWQLFPTAEFIPTDAIRQPGNMDQQGQDQGWLEVRISWDQNCREAEMWTSLCAQGWRGTESNAKLHSSICWECPFSHQTRRQLVKKKKKKLYSAYSLIHTS